MGTAVGILILILGLVLAIGLHEIGHLVPAKKFGVKVPQYFIGFGPTLFSRTRGETEYGLKAIPLGGYVRLAGMYPARPTTAMRAENSMVEQARAESRADLLPGEEKRDFASLTVPRKLAVMLGGPLMNWALALVLFLVVVVGFGTGTATTRVYSVSDCVPTLSATACDPAAAPSPALAAGIEPGDRILMWNGAPVTSWEGLQAAIRTSPTASIPVIVEREGLEHTLNVSPVLTERQVFDETGAPMLDNGVPVTEMVPFFGVTPSLELVRQSPAAAVEMWWTATGLTAKAILTIPQQLWNTVGELVNPSETSDRELVSLVGVGALAGSIGGAQSDDYTLAMRSVDMMTLLASLNIALFAFNLIPLPPLDGGHIAGAMVEGLRRTGARIAGRSDPGPVDTARLLPVAYAVIWVLIGMTVILVWADIANPIV